MRDKKYVKHNMSIETWILKAVKLDSGINLSEVSELKRLGGGVKIEKFNEYNMGIILQALEVTESISGVNMVPSLQLKLHINGKDAWIVWNA